MSGIQVNNVFHGCGRLGNEPDVKNQKDRKIISFSIAIDRTWTDGNGEKKKRTNWIRCVAFHPLSKYVEACHVHKGSKVSVTGSIEVEEFEKDGKTQKSFSVWLNGFEKQNDPKAAENETEQSTANANSGTVPEATVNEEDLPF